MDLISNTKAEMTRWKPHWGIPLEHCGILEYHSFNFIITTGRSNQWHVWFQWGSCVNLERFVVAASGCSGSYSEAKEFASNIVFQVCRLVMIHWSTDIVMSPAAAIQNSAVAGHGVGADTEIEDVMWCDVMWWVTTSCGILWQRFRRFFELQHDCSKTWLYYGRDSC
jgi:hypothetical protein